MITSDNSAIGGHCERWASVTYAVNSLSSAESISITGGTLSLAATSNIDGTLKISTGFFSGTGTLTVNGLTTFASGAANWTGMQGPGITNADGGLVIDATLDRTHIDGRTLNVSGNAMLSGAFNFRFYNAAVINLQPGAVWDVQGDNSLVHGGGTLSTFNNQGTFRKSASFGTSAVNIAFHNGGNVKVNSGD